jgi:hypothetical protein
MKYLQLSMGNNLRIYRLLWDTGDVNSGFFFTALVVFLAMVLPGSPEG